MPNLYHSIPLGDNVPEEINVIVEIPEGSHMKYEYDHEHGVFVLDRVNYDPMSFPINYAFVPQCWNSDDNDPADALLIATYPIAMGVMVPSRVIGMMEMIDTGEVDNKIVCVPVNDARLNEVHSVEDLPLHYRKQIEFFFTTYKKMKNKVVEVNGFLSKEVAFEKILKGAEDHKKKFGV